MPAATWYLYEADRTDAPPQGRAVSHQGVDHPLQRHAGCCGWKPTRSTSFGREDRAPLRRLRASSTARCSATASTKNTALSSGSQWQADHGISSSSIHASTSIPTIIVLLAAAYSWAILDDIEAQVDRADGGHLWRNSRNGPSSTPGSGSPTSSTFPSHAARAAPVGAPGPPLPSVIFKPASRRSLLIAEDNNPTDVDNIVRVIPRRRGRVHADLHQPCGWGHCTRHPPPSPTLSRSSTTGWLSKRELRCKTNTSAEAVARGDAPGHRG